MALRRLSSSINNKLPFQPFAHGGSIYHMSSLASQAAQDKEKARATWIKQLNEPLDVVDPEIADIIELEKARQWKGLELIPSENFTSLSVMQAVGSVMTNKYSEGYPGARYYGGNEYIDMAESLCQKRALDAFQLDPAKWGVNVQPLSGSPANFQAYTALLKPHERIMALDLPHGGHLSHGYQTDTKKISAVSIFFETMPYRLNESTGYIDYDQVMYDYEDKINQAVFPGLQGGPHNHTIAGLAVALKQVKTPEYKAYQEQVLSNCSKFAEAYSRRKLMNMESLWQGIDGSRVEKVLESVHIAANKNTVPGDVSAMVPGGIRMGTPALTSRGFLEDDFVKVAEYFDAAVKLALKIKANAKGTKLKDFVAALQSDSQVQSEITKLRHEVEQYAKQFPTVGFEKETMRYRQ
ncbi:hypothetical protein C1H46_043494 [Malus baccata]|uniref:glycine hydroxymethyltransferase n=1 Tax=Malus baccata TaxID=106549 RepID=A0A540K9R6_MALBA|nr:hypothetical protein C1H46_043494 [Malus baccata]